MKFIVPSLSTALLTTFTMGQSAFTPPVSETLPEVVVTGTPLGRTLFEQAQPVSVLTGAELTRQLQPTLGETLAQTPGVTSTYFGPAASRPIIRGLGDDRIRLLNNGVSSLDVSNVSPDHAVTIDPLITDKVEIVRGPATLLYGPNGVGGVVNVLDNRIAEERLQPGLFGLPIHGKLDGSYGSADDLRSGGEQLDIGAGPFVFHIDGFKRETDDLEIPGLARSDRFRRENPLGAGEREPRDHLPNSANETEGGALGVSAIWDSGFFGVSYSLFDSTYGTVAEPDVIIDLEQRRWDARGAFYNPFQGIKSINYKFSYSDYEHTEFEGPEVGTVFQIEGYNGRIDFVHNKLGLFEGAVGYETSHSEFSALGEEAFLPPVTTDTHSIFLFEEIARGNLRYQFGARFDHANVETDSSARFGKGRSWDFNAVSGSAGIICTLPDEDYAVALNASYTQRAPTYVELFADGPHVATNAFEVGDSHLDLERSLGLDLSLRKQSGRITSGLSLFYNRFDNFIALEPAGTTTPSPAGDIPVFDYAAEDVDFYGGELEMTFHFLASAQVAQNDSKQVLRSKNPQNPLTDMASASPMSASAPALDLELKADYVSTRRRGGDREGDSLPRIPPFRTAAALVYQHKRFSARLDGQYVGQQNRTAENELLTNDYFLINASVNYRVVQQGPLNVDFYVRGINLSDEEARVHSSFLKDIAPLGGRGVVVGMQASF